MYRNRYGLEGYATGIYSGLKVRQTGMVEGHVPQGVGVQVPPSAQVIRLFSDYRRLLPYMGGV